MRVDLKCFATLAESDACDYSDSTTYQMNSGQTVEELVELAGIDKNNVKIVFVNNKIVELKTELSDGDQVGLAPSVGGM
ncbi:MAG: MoaD/ThiS family protein [Desulfobacterales bacterium]|jgi:molybdopterin converting factor small subunit